MAVNKKQATVIWILVGLFVLSVVGGTALTLMSSNDDSDSDLAQELSNMQQAEPLPGPATFTVDGDVTELKVEDLKVGDGAEVKPEDAITVHYQGNLATNGEIFDSSYERGEPISFSLNEVIPGWQQGMVGMKVGGQRRLIIPSELAYGDQEIPGIPANSDLVFIVELQSIE